MTYYSIFSSNDLTIIGEYPQVEKQEHYNLSLPQSYWNVSWDNFPSFTPNYEIKIRDNALPTNLLHSLSGFVGITIDNKLKKVLEEHNLPIHKSYPINVQHRGTNLEYNWFHFIDSFLSYINFDQTIFELFRKSPFKSIEEFKISSIDELHRLEGELNFEKGIRVKKIVFATEFPNYDIISLRNLAPITLVSKRLKIALEKSGLNGFEFNKFHAI